MSRAPYLAAVAALSLAATPSAAQDAELAPTTHARRGAVIGAVTGGVLGGLSIGFLSSALCEYECNGAFLVGFVYGGVAGGAVGALTGLVIGAAIPRGAPEDESEEAPSPHPAAAGEVEPAYSGTPWTLRLAAGPRFGTNHQFGGTDWWTSLTALRATSTRVRWGMEVGYLGHRSETEIFTLVPREGEVVTVTNVWERRMWTASLVAARSVGSGARPAGYILATAGVYPYREVLTTTREGDAPDVVLFTRTPRRDTTPYPGVGVGTGGTWRLGPSVGVGLDARLHMVLGAGNDLGIPLATVGGTVWIGR